MAYEGQESEGGAPIHSPAVGVSRERVLPKNYFNYLVLRNCQLGFEHHCYRKVSKCMLENDCPCPLLLDLRSIDIGGAQEKEGYFHYKYFLRASK